MSSMLDRQRQGLRTGPALLSRRYAGEDSCLTLVRVAWRYTSMGWAGQEDLSDHARLWHHGVKPVAVDGLRNRGVLDPVRHLGQVDASSSSREGESTGVW